MNYEQQIEAWENAAAKARRQKKKVSHMELEIKALRTKQLAQQSGYCPAKEFTFSPDTFDQTARPTFFWQRVKSWFGGV